VAGDAPLASTVLKAGHHGSKASTGEAFVAAVNPGMAVIKVGAENDDGHSSPEPKLTGI
jgi:beta-lactamase superfamily II metal-dependent hydrolase